MSSGNHITTWVLELVDKVSSPFKSINRWAKSSYVNVAKLDKRVDVLKGRISTLTDRSKKLALTAGAFALMSAGSVEFSYGMARANTMLQAGDVELAKYTNQVQNLAVESGKAKSELAEGLYNTISAGVPKQNAIQFLTDSTKAAVGGTAELGTVVDATSGFIKNYNESWQSAGKIQDKFQKTVQLGQINGLGELASALPRVTNLSAQLGTTQEEMLAIFATGSGVLGKSAEVSTMLGATLTAFVKPSAEASKMAEKLGIAFNSNVIQKAGGLKNYIDVLMPRIKVMSEQTGTSQEEIIGKLFGSAEAIKLVMALGGNLNQSWATNTTEIANSTGSVQKAFNTMMGETKSKLGQLKNVFSNNLDTIVGTLKPLTDLLIDGVIKVAKWTSAFMQSHPVLTKTIVISGALVFGLTTIATIATLVSAKIQLMGVMMQLAAIRGNWLTKSLARAALGTLNLAKSMLIGTMRIAGQITGYTLLAAYGIGSFIASMITATAAQWGLNIAMNANPIGLIVLGLTAVVGVIMLVVKYWDVIKAKIVQFGKFFIQNHPFRFLIDLVDKVFPGFKEKVQEIFSSVINWFKRMWDSIKGVWNSITAFFGFGNTKAEVVVKKSPDDEDPTTPVLEKIQGGGNNTNFKGLLTGSGSNNSDGVTGGTGEGKKVVMNLDIKNYFNLQAGNWRDQLDDIADSVIGKINDGLRDGLIIAD